MPIAIYARKSIEGEDRQVQSLEDQVRELRRLAQREGLPEPIVYEEARSAKEPGTRPEFARLMADVEAGRIGGILTWSISRLARNSLDGGLVAYRLQSGRLPFIRTPERTYRPEDNALLLSVESGMATAYSQDLARNVRRGMRGKAERGWHSSKAPLGYRNDPETRQIVRDEERWAHVRRAFDMALAGATVGEIHREMVAAGLTIRSRRKSYGPVSRSYLHALLRAPFYVGVLVFKGERFAGAHEAMVSEAEFLEVQRRIGTPRMVRRPQERFAFSNTFRCSACRCAVVGERRTKTYKGSGATSEWIYYHCTGSKGCPKVGVREEALTNLALSTLRRGAVSPGVAAWLSDALVASLERSATDGAGTESELARAVAKEEGRLRRLTEMRLDGELSGEEYARTRVDVEARLGTAREVHERARTSTSASLARVRRALDASVGVWYELERGKEPDARAVGRLLRMVGVHALNPVEAVLRAEPHYAVLAAFEPPKGRFQSLERGDLVPLSSVWWTLVEDLLQIDADLPLNHREWKRKA